MFSYAGLISSAKRSMPRAISSKVATARARALRAKERENPLPFERKPAPKRVINLKFPLQTLPKSDAPSGWLGPIGGTEKLPFQFTRTENQQLPVYSDIKNGHSRRVTVLRKYSGDVRELKDELARLLGESTKIEEHSASLQINGHHVLKLKRWLRRLGF